MYPTSTGLSEGSEVFQPCHAPTLRLWVEADRRTVLRAPSFVERWEESGPLSRIAAQVTLAKQPTLDTTGGVYSVRFGASTSYLPFDTKIAQTSAVTIYFIIKRNGAGLQYSKLFEREDLGGGDIGPTIYVDRGGTDSIFWWDGSVVASIAGTASRCIVRARYSGTPRTMGMRINMGAEVTALSVNPRATSWLGIGANDAQGTNSDISAALIYDTDFSTNATIDAQIMEYLSKKWNIAI